MDNEDDIFLEIDFYESKISFICRNPKCKHENTIDLKTWKAQQKHSALPKIGLV